MVDVEVAVTCDVVVVGGGVIGASSAWWLEQAGYSVALLEQRALLGTYTTPNALGTLRTQYGTPSLVTLAQESLEFYQHIEDRLGVRHDEIEFSNPGYAYLTSQRADVERLGESLRMYEGLGVTSSVLLDEATIRERYPFAGEAVAGIFHGDGSFVNPTLVTNAWASQLTGTTVLTNTKVSAIEPGTHGWTVRTSNGVVQSEAVVVAAGPLSPQLLSPFGIDMAVRITPRYRVFIPDNDPDHRRAPLVINISTGAYWRPVPGGVWLSTANVDDRSVEPGDSVVVPEGFLADAIDEIRAVSPRLADTAEAADPTTLGFAGGFQVYPVDDVPIIGAVPDQEGLFVNAGHWAGIMLSPASGRLLADVVSGRVSEVDNPCGFERFSSGDAVRASTNKFGGWG